MAVVSRIKYLTDALKGLEDLVNDREFINNVREGATKFPIITKAMVEDFQKNNEIHPLIKILLEDIKNELDKEAARREEKFSKTDNTNTKVHWRRLSIID